MPSDNPEGASGLENDDTYILLLLADSNLPTGSFVASSGLESYIKHGFGPRSAEDRTVSFVRDSLASYARSALPFVSDAHSAVAGLGKNGDVEVATARIRELDDLYETMTLNHVTRRASQSQGVALLTLYSKGFSRPRSMTEEVENMFSVLMDRYKLLVRREEAPGHLPICWGVLTAALGLTLERSQYLHLFLHVRSLLSAAIRLNEIGPYNAQQIMLHIVKPLVAEEIERRKTLRTNPDSHLDDGPANTWPLGEILAARHDQQHSRIFNS